MVVVSLLISVRDKDQNGSIEIRQQIVSILLVNYNFISFKFFLNNLI
jgi:hypothetical protein